MKKDKCILLFAIIIAFIGWLYETILMYVITGEFQDRGFITLPFCPIYAITILLVYYLIGTPYGKDSAFIGHSQNGGGLVKYYLLCAIIPTVCEFIGGNVMELLTGEVLWDYSTGDYSIGRYISLDVSLFWGILIFCVMSFYNVVKKYFYKIPDQILDKVVFTFSFAIFFDFLGNSLTRFIIL